VGGLATADATVAAGRAVPRADASGGGGSATGLGFAGGGGGVAGATASAIGVTYAEADVSATAGYAGSGLSGANADDRVNETVTHAVSGETQDGTLVLQQSANATARGGDNFGAQAQADATGTAAPGSPQAYATSTPQQIGDVGQNPVSLVINASSSVNMAGARVTEPVLVQ